MLLSSIGKKFKVIIRRSFGFCQKKKVTIDKSTTTMTMYVQKTKTYVYNTHIDIVSFYKALQMRTLNAKFLASTLKNTCFKQIKRF